MYNRRYKKNTKTYKKNYRRRRNNRYKKKGGKLQVLRTKNVTGISDATLIKFKFAYIATLNATGGQARFVFKANSCFAPSSTSGQHAAGFEEWLNFYDAYMVNASKISVRGLAVNSTAGTANCTVNLYPSSHSVGTTPIDEPLTLLSNPYNRNRLMTVNSSQGANFLLKNYMGTRKIFGLPDIPDQVPYSGFVLARGPGFNVADPSEQWSWVFQVDAMDSASTIIIDAQVVMTFYVRLYDRIQLPQ